MARRFRAIVVGCGAIGAATAYWLSRQVGGEVLVLEQYELGHTLGASEDHSRIIRHAYVGEEYTALTPAAYQSWATVERATGLGLVHRTGGLFLAESQAAASSWLEGAAASMTVANLPYDELTGTQVTARWPQWRLDDRHRALFDPEAGILDIRTGSAAMVALARAAGVTTQARTPMDGIEETGSGVRVRAGGSDYEADVVVLAGGAWNPALLAMLGADLPIALTEEQVTYFATANVRDFLPDRFPVFSVIAEDELCYYGFPVYGEVAVKVGVEVGEPVITPEQRSYAASPARVEQLRRFLETYLPGAVGPELRSKVCCYDFPPDRGFILDYVPGHERVLVGAGAGHAGKFAALFGRILAELALEGESRFPIEAFRADRPTMSASAASEAMPRWVP